MFNVSSAEEALAIARDLCQRHRGLISHNANETPRDAALRVILAEAAHPGSHSPARSHYNTINQHPFINNSKSPTSPRNNMSSSGGHQTSALHQQQRSSSLERRQSSSLTASPSGAAAGSKQQPLQPTESSNFSSAAESPSGTFRPPLYGGASSSFGGSSKKTRGPSGKSAECFYCNEPTSRFCKETGRRHETGTQKAIRQWRRIYRQLALAASFVSTARLAKVNTCVEEYAIELNLDDI